MNCPRCGKPIGGYVTAGSTAASRVSKGLCPHCGGSMPRGYKVGFANSSGSKPRPQPTYYKADAVKEIGRKGPYKGICTILNGVLGGLFCILNHHLVIGIIFAVVIIAAAVVYYFLYADAPALGKYDYRTGTFSNDTQTSPINNGLMIASLAAGLFLSLATYRNPGIQSGRGRLYWILGTFGFSLILQAFTWRHTYKWAIGAAVQRQKDEQKMKFYEYFLEQLYKGNIKCGKCGKTIDSLYSVAFKDDGAIVLCDECFPWKKNGQTEVGDLVFRHESM